MTKKVIDSARLESLYVRISHHIDKAQLNIQRTINTEIVNTYWSIGREIVEEEQEGQERAEYGKSILKVLSERLQDKYQRGFSVDTLEQARRFYLTYLKHSDEKSDAVRRKSYIPSFNPNLYWTHYRELIRIPHLEARRFYEIEAAENKWASRELKRQIGSLLFERLLKSKDKEGLLRLSHKGQEVNTPRDAIKDPVILEFLGLPESHQLVESKLEEALINNLQRFLLELGKGFAFVARQKRLTLDGTHFYADLVFYHTLLKCYVVVDLKTHHLTPADLGQMLLYVNYFDQEIKTKGDNPTIGLVLCTDKSETMVKYMLGEKAKQVFASKYQFHLPTEEMLTAELRREIKEVQVKFNKECE